MSRISKLKICEGIPFGLNDNVVLTFHSYQEQTDFFENFVIDEFNNLSFIKGFFNKKIKVDTPIDNLYNANYVVFNNEDYGDKNFYAYIVDFEYISDSCTAIIIEIDYFQTYMGDIVFLASDIERQMTRDDDIENIYNQLPEPIQIDRYFIAKTKEINFTSWRVCVLYKPNLVIEGIKGFFGFDATNISGDDTYNYRDLLNDSKYRPDYNIGSYVYNKYMTGCAVKNYNISSQVELETITTKLWLLELTGYSVVDVYMIPSVMGDNAYSSVEYYAIGSPYYDMGYIPTGADTYYQPLNNKTYMSPYVYLELSNYMGGKKNYTYQNFFVKKDLGAPDYDFRLIMTNLNGFSGYIYPKYYGAGMVSQGRESFENGLDLPDVAHCPWNENKIGQGLIKGGIGTGIAAAATAISGGATLSAIAAEATNRQNQTGEYDERSWNEYEKEYNKIEKQKQQRNNAFFNEVGNAITNGDGTRQGGGNSILNTVFDFFGFKFSMFVAVNIIAIDRFFSMYGYYQNRITNMNIVGNANFNYIKTKNARVAGNIPIYAKEKIINMLNNGITFWHNLNNFQYNFSGNHITDRELINGRIF